MRYLVLASDYDGTLAHDGVVDDGTMEALARLRESGRNLVMVTGRELPDLLATFDHLEAFDLVVAENGAVLYTPETKTEKVLAEAPSTDLITALRAAGVEPLSVGRVILATWDSQKQKVLEAIHRQGLEAQIIFNKGSLMILPPGVNKATGLKAALCELGVSLHNTLGVGDAENDHAFLASCECAVAVANALPSLQERADWITAGARGTGVQELVQALLKDDLASLAPRLKRHDVLLGTQDGVEVTLPVYGAGAIVAGTSGGGKSTLSTGFLERLHAGGYQFCAIDPEGDYQSFPGAVVVGDAKRAPNPEEVLTLLAKPEQCVIINLLGIVLEQRPDFLQNLLPQLMELRARKARPHWIVIDEAHHLLGASQDKTTEVLPREFTNILLITLEPDHVDREVLGALRSIVAVGEKPDETIRQFASACCDVAPACKADKLEKGHALLWSRERPDELAPFEVAPSSVLRVRHSRKYAAAELSPDRSFYFRGPEGKLKLRAQNLMLFLQIMDGVDDETWLYHFGLGEYSQWFRKAIKSDDLADAAADVEKRTGLSAEESRRLIREQVEQRYTAPA